MYIDDLFLIKNFEICIGIVSVINKNKNLLKIFDNYTVWSVVSQT